MVLLPGGVYAQTLEAQLVGISQTPPQASVAAVIANVCPKLSGGGDLQVRCTEIVVNGSTVGGAPQDVAGSRAGLQGMAAAEDSVLGVTQSDVKQGESQFVAQRISLARTSAKAGRSTIAVNGKHMPIGGDQKRGLSAGGLGTGPWNLFVDLAYADSDRDATARQSGFDADSWLVRAGLEYDYSQDGFVGGALSYTRTDASLDASGGTVETDDYQVFAYGTRYLNAAWHIDGSLGFSYAKMDTERAVRYQIAAVGGGVTSVDQLALSDTNASTLWADVMLGYDINRPGWIAMPYAKLQIARVKIDGFTERMSKPGEAGSGLATQIDDQGITSVPVALGGDGRVSYPHPIRRADSAAYRRGCVRVGQQGG